MQHMVFKWRTICYLFALSSTW